jgi:predicted transcriptional regulator
MNIKKNTKLHKVLLNISINRFDDATMVVLMNAGLVDITITDKGKQVLEKLGTVDIKFNSEKHLILKELKACGCCRFYNNPSEQELRLGKYIFKDNITQKGLDKLAELEKDKVWMEKSLILAVVYWATNLYRLQAVELGLLIKKDNTYSVTEKGHQYLNENIDKALLKYKFPYYQLKHLLKYVNDISILPTYLVHDTNEIRIAAQKRFDELKGEN